MLQPFLAHLIKHSPLIWVRKRFISSAYIRKLFCGCFFFTLLHLEKMGGGRVGVVGKLTGASHKRRKRKEKGTGEKTRIK